MRASLPDSAVCLPVSVSASLSAVFLSVLSLSFPSFSLYISLFLFFALSTPLTLQEMLLSFCFSLNKNNYILYIHLIMYRLPISLSLSLSLSLFLSLFLPYIFSPLFPSLIFSLILTWHDPLFRPRDSVALLSRLTSSTSDSRLGGHEITCNRT